MPNSTSYDYPTEIGNRGQKNIEAATYEGQQLLDIMEQATRKLKSQLSTLYQLGAAPIKELPPTYSGDAFYVYNGVEIDYNRALGKACEIEEAVDGIEAQFIENLGS
ncbi:hypothetical protein LTR12_006582 [Friedmanniomyces endolithicus]|nr:hypothetical protein LTR12_006582 [Friedmanniomyces endolithicus]